MMTTARSYEKNLLLKQIRINTNEGVEFEITYISTIASWV